MPTYQYACRSCDYRFERVQGFHEDALTLCPECRTDALRKLFGNVGVVFKGSGFYRTDSRSTSSKGAGAAKDPKPAAKESGSTTTTAPKDGASKPPVPASA